MHFNNRNGRKIFLLWLSRRAGSLLYDELIEYDESQAIALFAYTAALAYLSPIVGALLADAEWGRYATIVTFGIIYVIGLAILTAAAGFDWESLNFQRFLSGIGLFLVCLGTGGIKPCVSAFGADQIGASSNATITKQQQETSNSSFVDENFQEDENLIKKEPNLDPRDTSVQDPCREEQVRVFFSYFYFCINVGSVTSIALIPVIRGRYGFGASFLLPTIFMAGAMVLFLSMRRHYAHHIPGQDGSSLLTAFSLCWWLLRKDTWVVLPLWATRSLNCLRPGPMPFSRRSNRDLLPIPPLVLDACGCNDAVSVDEDATRNNNQVLRQQLDDAAQALHVLPIMAMLPIFWCLYDQQGSVWTLQATRMDRHGLQPEQLNVINPVEIMIIIPLFSNIIYPWMERNHWNIRPLRRMSYGMFLAAVAFFLSGLVETSIRYHEDNDLEKVNVFWQLPQLTVLSVSEIFVSVTGLEFAYSTSPDRLKAFIMALFLLTTAVGDFLSGILYSTIFANLNRALVLFICGLLMIGNLALFCQVANWWETSDRSRRTRNSASSSAEGLEIQELRVV
jgi:dipeptide/tripeptide permease